MTLEELDEGPNHEPDVPVDPRPVFTYILIGSIAAVFLSQILFGEALRAASESPVAGDFFSVSAAGFVKQYFLQRHEYWRILTGATVHGGWLHFLMNSYALLMFGRLFEMLSGRAHLAIVFLLSCVVGGLFSLYFLPDIPSVGASGGIVGLLGYITVYAFRRHRFISPQFRKSLLINIGFLFFFGLVLYNVVDNFGHLGGLLTGATYGIVQIPASEYVDPRVTSIPTRYVGEVALGIYMAGCALGIFLIAAYHFLQVPQ
jgi:membrane associated rhomboid family serine protease